jgi:hypothetical protein
MAEFKNQSLVFVAVSVTEESMSLARTMIAILGQYGVGMKAIYNPQIAYLMAASHVASWPNTRRAIN